MLLTLVECVKYRGADQTIKMHCVYWLFQIPGAYYLWPILVATSSHNFSEVLIAIWADACVDCHIYYSLFTSVVNSASQKILYCREALKMPKLFKKKVLQCTQALRRYRILTFPIHFLWRSRLSTAL